MPENEKARALRPTAPGMAGQNLRKRESDVNNATPPQHYQLFPALEPATEAALKASIARFGVLVPVTVDQHGNILDGHHRKRIADELGVDCDIRVRRVDDDDEANEIARTLNMDRRHLSAEDRRRMVEALRTEGHSYRAIAGALGVDAKTAWSDARTVESSTVPDWIVGLDGKSRPARRPEPITPPAVVTEAALTLAAAEPDRDDNSIEAEAQAIADVARPRTVADLTLACADNLESRRTAPVYVECEACNGACADRGNHFDRPHVDGDEKCEECDMLALDENDPRHVVWELEGDLCDLEAYENDPDLIPDGYTPEDVSIAGERVCADLNRALAGEKVKREPFLVPKRSAGEGVPPHPATYPQAVMAIFRNAIPAGSTVLDPFGGVGTIHELRPGVETHAIEIEAEWAGANPHTVHGDSTKAGDLYPVGYFDAIATSPAYGNRLADAFYNASDAASRNSYALDLGRPLDGNSGARMHFAKDGSYEDLHRAVWAAVVPLLRPGGLFLLNCKDFQRDGQLMRPTGWNVEVLTGLGLRVVDLYTLPAKGLPFASAAPMSELVVVLVKPGP